MRSNVRFLQEYLGSHNIVKREPQDSKEKYEEQSFKVEPQYIKAEYEERSFQTEPQDIKNKNFSKFLQKHAKYQRAWYVPGSRYDQDQKKEKEYEKIYFKAEPQDIKAEYEEQFVKADIKEEKYGQGNWLEHKAPDNRPYFCNDVTQASSVSEKANVKKLIESKRKSNGADLGPHKESVFKKTKPIPKPLTDLAPLPKPIPKPSPYSYAHPEECAQCPKCFSMPKNKNLSKHLQKHAKFERAWYVPGSRYDQDQKKGKKNWCKKGRTCRSVKPAHFHFLIH